MFQMPVKFRVAQIIFHNEGVSNQAIYEMLKKEYPLDRNVNEKGVEANLLSLKAVGIIQPMDAKIDEKGNLIQYYQITQYGSNRMTHLNINYST
ncbi:MAG: hypothetical protein ACRKFN_11245 [Desulfitobacterium sp.]